MIYFDNAATTKPCREAVEAVNRALVEDWGNPSSVYGFGVRAENIINGTRQAVASLLSCDKKEIFFTSGGTEANALAVFGAAEAGKRRGNRIVTTAAEHSSVLENVKELEKRGFEVVLVKPGRNGDVSPDDLAAAINRDTVLVSVMLVNNETGAIFPVKAAVGAVKTVGAPAAVHCDAVQAFGKIPFSVRELGVDLLTASSHKIHGPKGCGILYKSEKVRIMPLWHGGEQETRLRPGTEAVPAIAGFGAAVKALDIAGAGTAVRALYDRAKEHIAGAGYILHSPAGGSPYVINFSVPGFKSETLLHALEGEGICVSAGSACAKNRKSHVLMAMGLPQNEIDSALRVSFSPENTPDEVDRLFEVLRRLENTLIRVRAQL